MRDFRLFAEATVLCIAKQIPFVGSAVDVVDNVRKERAILENTQQLEQLSRRMTRMESRVRDATKDVVAEVLEVLKRPLTDTTVLEDVIREFQEMQRQGYNAALFEGLFSSNPYYADIKRKPQNFGRVLGAGDTLDQNMIKLFIDMDQTKILELSPFALQQLLQSQQSVDDALISSGSDIWSLPQRSVQPAATATVPASAPSRRSAAQSRLLQDLANLKPPRTARPGRAAPQARGTPLTFHVYQNEAFVQEVTLREKTIKIGKLESSHLRIEDDRVSRMHAVIEVNGPEDIQVIDLGSSAGTFVRGEKVNKCKLEHGDEITLGDTRVFIYIGEPRPASSPQPVATSPQRPKKSSRDLSDLKRRLGLKP